MLSKILNEVSDEKKRRIENTASLASGDYKIVEPYKYHMTPSEGNKNSVLVLLWGRG